jgi:acetolactate synthase I/II/III large subunit
VILKSIAEERAALAREAATRGGTPIHPLRLVAELQHFLSSDITLCSDMGSFHLWLARHLYSFKARQILISNGQQTLGIALPWAIAASIVRLKANIVNLVWIDGTYDMVATQEVIKYGRKSGVDLGPVDLVKYAEAFGAVGRMIRTPDDIVPVLKEALDHPGPIIVDVHVDYSDNHKLFEMAKGDSFH